MKHIVFICAIGFTLLLSGCFARSQRSVNTAILWTDCVDFVSYAELYNKSQTDYQIFVKYYPNIASALLHAEANKTDYPDIAVGSWIKGTKTRFFFKNLESLFSRGKLEQSQFYEPLLKLGNSNGKQYLLPISFNIPIIMFHKDNERLSATDFVLPLETVRKEGAAFNKEKNGLYTNMGFIPRHNEDFLYTTAVLFNTSFRESGSSIIWNQTALQDAVDYLRKWTINENKSVQQENDFIFKYMYEPDYRLISGKRTLMEYISSKDFFMIPPEKRQDIDYRWLVKTDVIPVEDKIEYMGICEKGKNRNAAKDFIIWFFNESNQQEMIQRFYDFDMQDSIFGIAGGFSSLRAVNENVLPRFYPSLIGHLPRLESLLIPAILPDNWKSLKDSIVIPYLREITSAELQSDSDTQQTVDSIGVRIENMRKIQH